VTAARRPVTVRERILRLLHTTLAASRDTLAQHARTVEQARRDLATANGRADRLGRDKAQAQRERNAALDRAAIAERRLAAHCAEWAPRAAAAGLRNAPTHPGAALTDTAGADPRPPAPAATTHAQRSDDTPS